MRHREFQHLGVGRALAAHQRPGLADLGQHGQRLLVEHLAGVGQGGRVARAVDQFGAHPRLERLNAPRERRLRDMPQLRRAREAVRLGQADEVFKPFDFHGADYRLPAARLHDKQIHSNFLPIIGT
ncbi:hypothetical protein D3C86_1601300 [compost metagenome]